MGQYLQARQSTQRQILFLPDQRVTIRALMQPSKRLFSHQCMKCFDPTIEAVAQVATAAELLLAAGNALCIVLNTNIFPVLSLPILQ